MVFLTEKGKDLRMSIDSFFKKATLDFVNEIESEELNTTYQTLEKVLANLVHLKKKSQLGNF